MNYQVQLAKSKFLQNNNSNSIPSSNINDDSSDQSGRSRRCSMPCGPTSGLRSKSNSESNEQHQFSQLEITTEEKGSSESECGSSSAANLNELDDDNHKTISSSTINCQNDEKIEKNNDEQNNNDDVKHEDVQQEQNELQFNGTKVINGNSNDIKCSFKSIYNSLITNNNINHDLLSYKQKSLSQSHPSQESTELGSSFDDSFDDKESDDYNNDDDELFENEDNFFVKK